MRIAALAIAALLVTGCTQNAQSNGTASLASDWTSQGAKPGAGYESLKLHPDGTGVGIYRVGDEQESSEKTQTLAWHADGGHLWMTEAGQSQGAEFDYNVAGGTLTFGPTDGSMRYVMERADH